MKARKIAEGVFWVGAVDWDRRLFDALIPLPDGTSYNAYLIRGSEKTVLIDTVDHTMTDVLMSRLDDLDLGTLDYVVVNHAEQDHSGSLAQVLARFPQARVLATSSGKRLIVDLLGIGESRITVVEDGERLSLGDKNLEFVHTPWVHWPDTMCTYLHEDKILFSCDFFGSHLATSNLFSKDDERVAEAAKRYYAEVMMPFRVTIRRNLEKIKEYPADLIAPSHGPIHNEPACIVEYHRDWVSDRLNNDVVIPYVSMHGSTAAMVDYLTEALAEKGIRVEKVNLAVADIGKMASSLVDAATIVVGSPTVLAGAHPLAVSAAFLANALRPKVKYASIIGSYGWGGKMVEQITAQMPNLKVEMLQPVVVRGYPKDEDFKALDRLASEIALKHSESGII